MFYANFGRRSLFTPQTEPIPGSNQIQNHAGGYSYTVDDLTQLKRFLILGSNRGTYYVKARELTKDNLEAVERLLKAGRGREVVDTIVEISEAGRAASNDPALFALARCCACDVHPAEPLKNNKSGKPVGKDRVVLHPDDIAIRQYAYAALPRVARTGTHFLHFQEYVKQFRGRGPVHDRAIESWYQAKRVEKLAYQVLKYQQRDGWAQKDVLRLARPKPASPSHNALYRWITKGWESLSEEQQGDEALKIISAYERLKRTENDKKADEIIKAYKLPREAVPTQFLHSRLVWEALLEDMPMEAMLRNLGVMTKEGVISPLGDWTHRIASRLNDAEMVRKARLHPIKILAALSTYVNGRGVLGSNSWEPNQQIANALNEAFYHSFSAVVPTNKRILLAIDTSGSMHHSSVNGLPGMDVHAACGAMAMVIARAEPRHVIIGVDTDIQELNITPSRRLDDIVRDLRNIGGGGTDLSLPMLYALNRKIEVDAFVILTDSVSWAGTGHASQFLDIYRGRINPQARIINVQMTATGITNNAPDDPLALETVGFDTAAPELISSFIRGEI